MIPAITVATRQTLIDQMPDHWKGVYTWLLENCYDTRLVVHDYGPPQLDLCFAGQIKVYTPTRVVFLNFDNPDKVKVVTQVVTENGLDTFTDWLELASPDFFTQLEALLSSDAEEEEDQ